MTRLKFLNNKWTWLAVLSCFVAGLAVVLSWWGPDYWSARSMLIAAKASIRERGEPLAFADLTAQSPDAYAVGDRVLAVVKEFTEPEQEFDDLMRADPPTPPGDYAALRDALRINREALDALAAIDTPSECRFRYDFTAASPGSTALPGVDGLGKARYLWRAELLQSLGTGDGDGAVRATVELCDTSQLLSGDPFLICQLFRARLGGDAVNSLQALIARVDLTPKQFRAIDRRLAEMESSYRLAGTIHAERAALYTTIENIGHSEVREGLESLAGFGPGGVTYSLAPEKWRLNHWASLSYRPDKMEQQTWMLERMTRLAELIDVPGPDAERQWQHNDKEISSFLESNKHALVSFLLSGVTDVRRTGLEYRQRLVASRLALRVGRYQAEKGILPDKLDDVLDDAMPEVPAGLITGLPPEYRVRPDGFTIRDAIGTENAERADSVEVNYESNPASQ